MPTPANPAFAAAVRLLAHKRYTKVALADKLRGCGYAPEVVDDALLECERRRYVDDRTFAQLYIRTMLERKPVGKLRLVEALARQGVSDAVAAEVLSEHDADEDSRIDRALVRLAGVRPQDSNAQLARRLERLGFGAPVIARALRRRAQTLGAYPDGDDFEVVE